MLFKGRNIKGLNIVITGASSGNGKAMALLLAYEGANLVLGSRREVVLQEVASECEVNGGRAIAVKTDIAHYADVKNLMDKAISTFGSIDIWINNAGVLAAGSFTETPLDVHEQVININLIGQLRGLYAILPYFKEVGRGQIINTVSLGAFVPTPYASAYAASKFGLRGLTEALRGELENFPEIMISDVNPAFVDTPGIEHAANFSGRELIPAPPLYDPYQVARTVKNLIKWPRATVMVGGAARAARVAYFMGRRGFTKTFGKIARSYFKNAKHVNPTRGNLFDSDYADHEARGEKMVRPSLTRKIYDHKLPLH